MLGRSCSLRDCSRALLQAVPAAHRWCSNALGWVGAFPPVLKLSCCTACSPRAAPRSVLDSPTGQAQARQMSSLPREFLAQRPLHPAVGAFQKSLKPAIIELLNSVISLQRNKQTKKAVPPFLFFFFFSCIPQCIIWFCTVPLDCEKARGAARNLPAARESPFNLPLPMLKLRRDFSLTDLPRP